VTTADTTASARPGAPIASGGSSLPAVHALDEGPKTTDGTHLASSRSARHDTASRATVSASTFAMTTPSAARAAPRVSTGSNEFAIAFRDDPPDLPEVRAVASSAGRRSAGRRARGVEEIFDPHLAR
jgi:hypothetical protein